MRVLVTSGACEEAIDHVRGIVNHSTGATGAAIADRFAEQDAEVTLIHGHKALLPETSSISRIAFEGARDLEQELEQEITRKNPDVIIHAVAVSDYTVKDIGIDGKWYPRSLIKKLPSHREILIRMQEGHKIIDNFRKWKGSRGAFLVGFKLTAFSPEGERGRKVRELFAHSGADIVVANDLSHIKAGFHRTEIWENFRLITTRKTKRELADVLVCLAKERVCN